jgi:hypothetical protein
MPLETQKRRKIMARQKEKLSITDGSRIRWDYPDMILTRKDAVTFGFTVYRTGEPCKRGHTGWWRVGGSRCIECEEALLETKRENLKKLTPEEYTMLHFPDVTITPEEAKLRDFSVYRDGNPCKKGHKGWRKISDGECLECESLARQMEIMRKAVTEASQKLKKAKKALDAQNTRLFVGKKLSKKVPRDKEQRKRDSRMMKYQPGALLSRENAIKQDLGVFRTGDPCTKGHHGWQYVANSNCVTCVEQLLPSAIRKQYQHFRR